MHRRATKRGRPARPIPWVVCGGLLLAVALVFGRTLTYGFTNCDDGTYVAQNPHVLHGLSAGEVGWAFTDVHTNFWIPLVWLSYMLDSQLFGAWAPGYHLTNVLLHAATAAGLFLVLRRMTGDLWAAALAAALFALHPLRAESVAWVAERKDVLNGLFFVLALAAYAAYARRPFSLWRYLLVVACFVLSLLAKPMTVTLPVVLLLLDIWPLARLPQRGGSWFRPAALLVVEKLPLLVLAALFSGLTVFNARSIMPAEQLPWLGRLGNVLCTYVVYLQRMLWPAGLALNSNDNGLPDHPSIWAVAGSLAAVAAISAAVVAARRRHPYLLIGWLWYLVMLLPVSGLLPQGLEPRPDRFTYLPQIGLAIALAWGATAVVRAFPARRRFAAAVAGAVLICMSAATWRQTGFWQDSQTLWTRSLALHPHCARAWYGLGSGLSLHRPAEAIAPLQRAIELNPDMPEAYFNMGAALARLGRRSEALENLELVIRKRPNYAEAYCTCGDLLMDLRRIPEAIERYAQALRLAPDDPAACNNLGEALLKAGRADEALAHCVRAVELAPEQPAAHYNLGLCLAKLGRRGEAIRRLRESLRLAQASGQAQRAQTALARLRQLGDVPP